MRIPALAAITLLLGACGAPHTGRNAQHRPDPPRILARQTLAGHGAIQGVARQGDHIYIYSDAETGILREYTFDPSGPRLVATGRAAELTRDGIDALPHPTGLAIPPDGTDLPTFLGDTVRRTGLIHAIDLEQALSDGDLDNAIRNTALDDLATNGCRPEYVRADPDGPDGPEPEQWLVATADYGDQTNTLRLLKPDMLAKATRTSHPGVLAATLPAPTFVQTLHWLDDERTLVFVQNQIAGRRYRLTYAPLDDPDADLAAYAPLDLDEPTDELEGFVMLTDTIGLMVSATRPGHPSATFIALDGPSYPPRRARR